MDNNTSNGCGLLLLMLLAISAFAGFLMVFSVQSDAAGLVLLPTVAVQESSVVRVESPTPAATAIGLPSTWTPPPPTESPADTVVVTATPSDATFSDTQFVITVLGAGDLSAEAVELVNMGDLIDLTGWQIADSDGNVFAFPPYILYGGGIVRILTRSGDSSPIMLFWDQDTALWSPGETLTLRDAAGTVRASAVVGG